MNKSNFSKLSYRPEVDGLRAIAVASVILYHAKFVVHEKDWFQGGFIGVDIFFVISGYLITRIILAELQATQSFSFFNFYERRARRILPMLFVVIILSFPFAWYLLLSSAFVEYAKSVVASLFFGSNFFFYFSTTEYGADSALLKPFLHTWSLGVEEQFYIAFPIIALVSHKYFRAHFLPIIFGLSLVSLHFADYMGSRNSDLNFYLPFSRFWELAIGSLLAYYELNDAPAEEGVANKILPTLGLYLLLYSLLTFDGSVPHPSFYTLAPVIGVALIIGYAHRGELVGRILGHKALVSVGLVSYSAYLWHYPLFAFARVAADEPTNSEKILLIVIVFLFSVFSYFYVEQPARSSKFISSKAFFKFILGGFFGVMILMGMVIINDGYKLRHPKLEMFASYELDNNVLRKASWSLVQSRLSEGVGFDQSKNKVLIVGNSHGKDIFNALTLNKEKFSDVDFLYLRTDANFQISCFDESILEFKPAREDFYKSQAYKESTLLLVSSMWARSNKCDKYRDDWPAGNDYAGLESLIERARYDKKNVVLLGQSPKFSNFSREGQSRKPLTDFIVNEASLESSIGELKREAAIKLFESIDWDYNNRTLRNLSAISAEYNVPFYEKISVVCDVNEGHCDGFTGENEKMFYDWHHYTLEGARVIGDRLASDQGFLKLIQQPN